MPTFYSAGAQSGKILIEGQKRGVSNRTIAPSSGASMLAETAVLNNRCIPNPLPNDNTKRADACKTSHAYPHVLSLLPQHTRGIGDGALLARRPGSDRGAA